MKAIVAHHYWDRVGGGELVDAFVVKVLQDMGFEVVIVATTDFRKKKYKDWFGIDLEDVKTYMLLKKMIPFFGIYQRSLTWIPLKKAIKTERPSLIWIDTDMYKPISKYLNDARVVEYIHFPTPKWEETLDYHVKYSKGFWRLYFQGFLWMYKLYGRKNPFEYADMVFCNSTYIQEMIRELWNGEAIVIHPPVLVKELIPYSKKDFEERYGVAMIGRISPEKRYEDVIEAIALSDTKPPLRIVGGLIPSKLPYLQKIKRLAAEKKVKLEVHPNALRKKLIEVVSTSRIFIHSTRQEHFGIAPVEGMALGCPIIVHKSGGPYMDIIDFGKYGYWYDSIPQLSDNIDLLYSSEKEWKKLHSFSLKRCWDFDSEVFKSKVKEVVESLI